MSISEMDALKLAEKICQSSAFPTVIVDDQLTCVYSSCPKFVPVGTILSLLVKEPVELPLKKEKDVILFKDDDSYCARFIPLDHKFSFCQLMGFSEIMTLGSYTDMYSEIEQRLSMFVECSDNIKKYIDQINEKLPPSTRRKYMRTMDVNAEVDKMKTLANELSDFVYTALSPSQNDKVFDAYDMVNLLVNRINTILADYGKCIDFISDIDAYLISTNKRYALIAVLNAMQNALLYSPIKDVPVVSLTKSEKDDKSYVLLQVLNNIDNYTKPNGNYDPDLSFRRCGLGLPVIKKFVQRAGGDYYFEIDSTKARIGILIPEYKDDSIIVESGGFSIYDFGERDIIEEMMKDVISSIVKKKKRR